MDIEAFKSPSSDAAGPTSPTVPSATESSAGTLESQVAVPTPGSKDAADQAAIVELSANAGAPSSSLDSLVSSSISTQAPARAPSEPIGGDTAGSDIITLVGSGADGFVAISSGEPLESEETAVEGAGTESAATESSDEAGPAEETAGVEFQNLVQDQDGFRAIPSGEAPTPEVSEEDAASSEREVSEVDAASSEPEASEVDAASSEPEVSEVDAASSESEVSEADAPEVQTAEASAPVAPEAVESQSNENEEESPATISVTA